MNGFINFQDLMGGRFAKTAPIGPVAQLLFVRGNRREICRLNFRTLQADAGRICLDGVKKRQAFGTDSKVTCGLLFEKRLFFPVPASNN